MPSTAMHTKYSLLNTQTHYMILKTYYWTAISLGDATIIKGKIISMVTSLATNTNDILQITNLLNKCPMYTTDKEGDSHTLRKDENIKSQ